MNLLDLRPNGSFGTFLGHPDGAEASEGLVSRMLAEFNLDFTYFHRVLSPIPTNLGGYVTNLQNPIRQAFLNSGHGWSQNSYYPESRYKPDLGFNIGDRWVFIEVELSDGRRAVNAMYMSRAFRTGYMRLGIYITFEANANAPRMDRFYSSLLRRYKYMSPDFPLWLIGFSYP